MAWQPYSGSSLTFFSYSPKLRFSYTATRGGARGRKRGTTAPCRGTLVPHRGKLNNSSGNEIHGGNFKYSCLFSQTGKRKNELSALNVNNKSGEEILRENQGE